MPSTTSADSEKGSIPKVTNPSVASEQNAESEQSTPSGASTPIEKSAPGETKSSRPGQLYSTVSGHLYHAGKICIVMVGLPGRGKTLRSERIVRYLDWLGVPSRAFHLANYRRDVLGPHFRLTPEYVMSQDCSDRDRVRKKCLGDVLAFFKEEGGQVAVYDAVNARSSDRVALNDMFRMHGVECLFVESMVTDERMLARNVSEVRRTSPDYAGRDAKASLEHYLRLIEAHIAYYEPIREPQLLCIKLVNDGEQCVVNNGPLGYLLNRVLMFLLNFRRRRGSIFFARAGLTDANEFANNGDNDLNARGTMYAATLANTLMGYVSSKQVDLTDLKIDMAQLRRMADHKSHVFTSVGTTAANSTIQSPVVSALPSAAASALPSAAASALASAMPSAANSAASSAASSRVPSRSGSFIISHEGSRQSTPPVPQRTANPVWEPPEPPLLVWTSTRRKSIQTGRPFKNAGIPVSHKSLLNQLNAGDVWRTVDNFKMLKETHPAEYEEYKADPYHYRFPRAESYQDVALRLESLIMEMERVQTSLLVVGHESVLRVLYGYIMGLSTHDIPSLEFPANQIVEIVPDGYKNVVLRIPLAGVSLDGGVELPDGIAVEQAAQ